MFICILLQLLLFQIQLQQWWLDQRVTHWLCKQRSYIIDLSSDLSLNSLTQYGRTAPTQRPTIPQGSHSQSGRLTMDNSVEDHLQRSNAVPSLVKKKRRKRRDLITANTSGTRYEVGKYMNKLFFHII